MINFFQNLAAVENLLRITGSAEPPARKREALHELLANVRRDAAREITLMAAAIFAVAGKPKLRIPPEVFGAIPEAGFIITKAGDELVVELGPLPADIMALLQTLDTPIVTAQVESSPSADYERADPAVSDDEARARICNAVKTFVQRHYDGEIKHRGFGFMVTLWMELLALAVAVNRAQATDAPPIDEHLRLIGETLADRVEAFMPDAEQHLRELLAGGPDAMAVNNTRLH